MESRHQSIGHILAIATVIVWGATFVSTKVLLGHFTAEEILFLRFSMGLIALWLYKPQRIKMKEKSHYLYFIGASFTGLFLYYLCENIALGYGDASLIGVIVSSAPIFSGILSAIFLKEKLSKNFFIGFAFAMTGLFLLSWTAESTGVQILGIILAFAGAISWAFYSILIRKITFFGYDSFEITKYTFLFAVIMMIPVAISSGFRVKAVLTMNLTVFLNLVFLGLIASALCFVTWSFAVKQLGVLKSSVYIYASPVVTVVLAAIVLGERMNAREILGTVLVLLGLVLSEGQIFRRKGKNNDL